MSKISTVVTLVYTYTVVTSFFYSRKDIKRGYVHSTVHEAKI